MPTYYLVLVATWYIQLPLIEPLKSDYCEILPSRHFLCEGEIKEREYICFNDTVPIEINERKNAIKALNGIRAGVANGSLQIGHPKFTPPQAASMYQLKWDEECEKAAINIIRYCVKRPFFRKFSNIFARFEAGLYLDLDYYTTKNDSSSIADLLWNRIKGNATRFHDYNITSGNLTGPSFFHPLKLSILLKADVSVVGCAMEKIDIGSFVLHNLVCVFGGIATWDEPVILYENGLKCSKCPAESQCSKEYDSLCECKTRCYAYSRDVRKSGFYDSYAIVADNETNEDIIIPLKDLANGSYGSTYRYLHSTATMINSATAESLTINQTDDHEDNSSLTMITTYATTLNNTTERPITNLLITEVTTNLLITEVTTNLPTIWVTASEALTIKQTNVHEYSSSLTTIATYATTLKTTSERPISNLLITKITTNLPTIFSVPTEALTIKQTDVHEDGREHNFESISSEPSRYCIAITLFAAEIVSTFII